MSSGRRANWPRRALFAGYLLAATLAGLEVCVRLLGYAEHQLCDPIYMPFPGSADIPYVHKPGLVNARARGRAVINTDSLGLRSLVSGLRHGPKAKNEYRIAIVGDSGTFGEGVPRTEDTFPALLEAALNREQSALTVRVFNFAASGYSVKQMAATLSHRMLDVAPDLVVAVIIDHDFVLSRTPGVDSSGYLRDIVRGEFLAEAALRLGLRRVHLAYVFKDLRAAWSSRIAAPVPRGGVPESYSYLRQFARVAAERGESCLVVFRPQEAQADHRRIAEKLGQDRIPFLDLSALRREFTREQYMASRFDVHPSAAVHRRIAQELAGHILRVFLGTTASAS